MAHQPQLPYQEKPQPTMSMRVTCQRCGNPMEITGQRVLGTVGALVFAAACLDCGCAVDVAVRSGNQRVITHLLDHDAHD